ncbi:hypothetical protein DM01DRAFT_1360806 [Hesseltinella vesiculosa]|uniref:DUF2421 domain-containing protein n=1 Tax=Hesseltinella vesiculosa TaxID=101127 RepID=A0A1X2GXH2_9FUNG|nr:hypothetical protein DM01DRAFT_1360806 [Hesseltinella vesiculosa]
MSPSSEIEVVMDDGTLQRRTISLSTTAETRYLDTLDHVLGHGPTPFPSRSDPIMTSHDTIDSETEDRQPLLNHWPRPSYQSTTIQEEDEEETDTSNSDQDGQTTFFLHGGSSTHKEMPPTTPSIMQPDETPRWKFWMKRFGNVSFTPAHQAVLKCSFAYLLGSLFTFVPAWNALIGNNRVSSHLVATATVFFNPAKTLGGMVEAAVYGWGYTLFALVICLGSMVTTDFFIDHHLTIVAHLLSLFFWLAGSVFAVSFLKAHWNKPPVATASSLCFIIIFINVVKEGSANQGDFDTTRIQQITSAVAIGTLVTVACCIVFWPTSATTKLQQDLEKTLQSYQVLLKLLTKTFLLDDDLPEFTANESLKTAIDSHRSSFTSLQKSLKEAKLESLWNTQIRGCTDEYDAIIKSMERLSQHVGGLRSSCGIQFLHSQDSDPSPAGESSQQVTDPHHTDRPLPPGTPASMAMSAHSITSPLMAPSDSWSIRAGHRRRRLESEMKRQRMKKNDTHHPPPEADGSSPMEKAPAPAVDDVLSLEEPYSTTLIDYVQTIRRPLKSLAYTCKRTLYHLRQGLQPCPPSHRFLFSWTQPLPPDCPRLKANLIQAMELFDLAQRRALDHVHQPKVSEDLFLVYFFVFNLKEFTLELIAMVDAVHQLTVKQQYQPMPLWKYIYSSLARWWGRQEAARAKEHDSVASSSSSQAFVPNERHRLHTLHTPAPTTRWRKFFLRVWWVFSLFKLQTMRYAIKSTVAAILLAIPAFLSPTGSIFRTWRMEWALITLMVVMTPTVGGTNLVAVYRIFSTILGCVSAMVFYMLFPANMYVLPVLTWLFSIPNFWLILHHKHGKFGQFTLLAYNLVMLNKYNDREANKVEVWRLAFQRTVAILVGVVVGLIATNYCWPYEARVELRKGLSDFLLRVGWQYQRLISKKQPDRACVKVWVNQELTLQRDLIEMSALLAQTPNEPRLKGAFPVQTYRHMLDAGQNLVDKMIAIRTVVTKDVWIQEVYPAMVVPTGHLARDMVGNVLLYFYLLASALHLKTPLPPYFPPARSAWLLLIQELRQDHRLASHPNQQAYMIYFAYSIMIEDIIRDLDKLGEHMTMLFGALVPEEEWQQLFVPTLEQGTHGLSIYPTSTMPLTQYQTQ